MIALVWLFAKANWAPIAIVVGVFALGGGLFMAGDFHGQEKGKAAQMQATYEQLKERGATNEAVNKMPDIAKCHAIGGELRDGICN